jgi:catechol 2,3-dioxygenase-like lactoylglutathione lyase family enzyme
MAEFDQAVKPPSAGTRLRDGQGSGKTGVPAGKAAAERVRARGGTDDETVETVMRIATVALVVRDYDEAIGFYRDKLGFELVADTPLGDGKRWVLVAPPGGGARLLLARADGEAQAARVGDQTGGRVGLFLETADFAADFARFSERGVRFLEAPRHEAYGWVAVFEDLYGNKWDLIEPR